MTNPDPKKHGRKSWAFLWGEPQEHRGIRLRSKLELKFVLAVEERDGLILGETLLYEPKELRVTYVDPESNKTRSYWPDFYVPASHTVYEVKHVGRAKNALQKAKMDAFLAEHHDKTYVLLTEREVDALVIKPHEDL
jgi:hypothetical protein